MRMASTEVEEGEKKAAKINKPDCDMSKLFSFFPI